METLHKHFRALTREAFARHGFGQADLVASWPEIVGPELAAITAPESLRLPRGAEAAWGGATLHIRTAPGRTLEASYAAPKIIERVNAFLGYGAVAAVKARAATRWSTGPMPPAALPQHFAGDHCLATIADDGLRQALQRLGAGLAARRPGNPQGK